MSGCEMIILVRGDILKTKRETIAVPVNTVGVMGAGLAREIAARYQDAYRTYRASCKSGELRVGKLILIDWTQPKLLMFPTKAHWREKSTLEIIECGLVELRHYENCLGSLAVPALGCGLGGLNWKDVLPLMMKHLLALNILIDIYEPR